LAATWIFVTCHAQPLPQASRLEETIAREGPEGLMWPSASGQIMRRSNLQQVWIRAADAAGWPITAPLQRTAGYGQTNKGWRWTGAAKWSSHDLRHVAASWMLFDLGPDPAVVADKLGHADPNFTIKRYIGIRGNPDTAATVSTSSTASSTSSWPSSPNARTSPSSPQAGKCSASMSSSNFA
jgi:integrase